MKRPRQLYHSPSFRLFISLLFFLSLFLLPLPVKGQALTRIEGRVVDGDTGLPIENATIVIWRYVRRRWYELRLELHGRVGTDAQGRYEAMLERDQRYSVYTFYDDPNTSGFDYVPLLFSINVDQYPENTTSALSPGASIVIQGDLHMASTEGPPSEYYFSVKDPQTGDTIHLDEYYLVYGTSSRTIQSHNKYIDLDPKHLIIPAGVAVNIEATLFFDSDVNRTFSIGEHLNLSQGQRIEVNARKHSLPIDLALINDFAISISSRIEEMRQMGFYTTSESRDLSKITGLVESGSLKLESELYEDSYADLCEAYTKALNLDGKLDRMYVDATLSPAILVFFLTFTATAGAYLFFEGRTQKITTSVALYSVLVLAIYVVYPGCRFLPTALFLGTAAALLGLTLFFMNFLPSLFKEKSGGTGIALRSAAVMIFSMAKRNLRRRRFRTVLTMVTVSTLVMSFVALTSISTEYDLVVKDQSTTATFGGLLVKRPMVVVEVRSGIGAVLYSYNTFVSCDTSDIKWLDERSETNLVAPKAENFLSSRPLGTLGELTLRGYLGILPSAEAQITNINETVVEGRYLQDNDINAFLISIEAKRALGAEIGDIFQLSIGSLSYDVELVGVFDDYHITQVKELDGGSVMPKKLIIEPPPEPEGNPTAYTPYCDPTEMIITTLQFIQKFPNCGVSRISVSVKDLENTPVLARQVALERDYQVWAAWGGDVKLMYLGSFWELKGLSLLVPWGIVFLNMVVTMLNSLYERRGEISILSSVGLNPTHITGLFVAEATIVALIGGGIGYMMGLSWYPIMSSLSIALDVRQKVSVAWSMASIGIAMTAVLTGAITAIKSSVIVTPSLLRRWRAEPQDLGKPWTLDIPIDVPQSEIDSFMDHLHKALKASRSSNVVPCVEGRISVERKETASATIKRMRFVYRLEHRSLGVRSTTNELLAIKEKGGDTYTVELISKGEDKRIYETATFVRKLVLGWSVESRQEVDRPSPSTTNKSSEQSNVYKG